MILKYCFAILFSHFIHGNHRERQRFKHFEQRVCGIESGHAGDIVFCGHSSNDESVIFILLVVAAHRIDDEADFAVADDVDNRICLLYTSDAADD